MAVRAISQAPLDAEIHPISKNIVVDNLYAYEPLSAPHFMRLLNVHPPTALHDPILCSMQIVDPSDHPEYSALSYSWGMSDDGGASFSRQIIIDGKVKPVTQNLYEGLCRLRASESKLRIWIDAVYINQSNNSERSAQISAMASRFADAAKGLVWLGEGAEEQNRFVQRAIAYLLYTDKRPHGLPSPDNEDNLLPYNYDGITMQLFLHYGKLLNELNIFLGRRYFTRPWIVQELLNGREESTTFFWGSCSLSRHSFERFVVVWNKWAPKMWSYLKRWNELPRHLLEQGISGLKLNIHEILNLNHDIELESSGVLPRLLIECRDMHCAEPLDRVYALAGLDADFKLNPDYTVSVAALFIHVATKMIEIAGIKYVLGPQEVRSNIENLDLPTWVPDLRCLQTVPWIDLAHLEFGVDGAAAFTYNPFFLGTVVRCFDSEECMRRRQRPCIVLVPRALSGYSLWAGPMTFDDDQFEVVQARDLICFVPTDDDGAAVQIVREVPERDGYYTWAGKFLLYDHRLQECMATAQRPMFKII